MKKVSKQIIEFLISKVAKRFYWNTLNGAIGLVIVYFTQIDWFYAPIIIGVLNGITKEINTYLSK